MQHADPVLHSSQLRYSLGHTNVIRRVKWAFSKGLCPLSSFCSELQVSYHLECVRKQVGWEVSEDEDSRSS